ncbi:two-component regulator propeller domain-containing protein [Balneolales bacterium ANBcel1]|nr:two-component regulator propeller domain-containing protein [Balneolales bacterium ANBcel1]
MVLRGNFLVLLFLVCANSGASGLPGEQRGYPFITSFSPDEYNAHVQNWAFASDSNRVLHVANLSGILRFDGVNWNTIGIPNGRVLSIASCDAGRIYAGGLGEFGYLKSSEPEARIAASAAGESVPPSLAANRSRTGVSTVTASDSPRGEPVAYRSLLPLIPDSIEVDNIWRIEAYGGEVVFQSANYLFRYDGSTVTVYPAKTRFTTLFVRKGAFYVRESHHGVQRVGSDVLHPWEYSGLFGSETLQAYLKSGEREFFCSFYECFSFNQGELSPVRSGAEEYLRSNYIHEARVLSDGSLVIATRNGGIVQLNSEGELIRILNEQAGLISNSVYGLYEDESGSLWAATLNGLSRVELRLPFRRFDHRNGIRESVRRMTVHNGEVFLTSSAGVYRFKDDDRAELFDDKTFCNEFLHHQGYLYVTCTGTLHGYDGEGFQKLTHNSFAEVAAPFDSVSIVAAEESSVTVARLEGREVVERYRIDGLAINPNSILTQDRYNIWIGTESLGLHHIQLEYEGEHITGHTITHYLTRLQNRADDKRVYVAKLNGEPAFLTWGKGIQRFDHESDSMYTDERFGDMFTEPERQIFWAREDANGNVWFRSGMGYQVARPSEYGGYTIGEPVLNRLTDLQSNTIYPAEDGSVWFSTEKGLIRFEPEHRFDTAQQFHTTICEVMVRTDSLIAYGANENPVVLDYANNELRFHYAAASYDLPEQTVFRVKLEGFDSEWSAWSAETWKDYTNIPEGHYRFLVEAMNVYGTIAAAEPFHLQVLPPWYRTIWAYLLYVLTAGGILYTAYRVRLNQVLRVQQIRNNIAGDLHDEISATLSSISFFARAIESQRTKGDKSRFVKLISDSAGEAKEKISDIVWAINPEHDDWDSFLSRCRRYTSDLLESRKMTYTLDIAGTIPGKMDMQLRQHLWLIYKEMVVNVARHSEAGHVHVVIRHETGRLILIVQDDGKGMDMERVTAGNGLANIRRRTGLIGGRAELQSDPGMGTRWNVSVRI